jgi:hypothetical protein
MFDSGVIGVVIGLVLVYFLLSLLCSGVNEAMEAFLRRRSKFLEGGIVDLLGLDLKRQLYDHPLLETLYPQKGMPATEEAVPREDRKKPSYIPPAVVSHALLSILIPGRGSSAAQRGGGGPEDHRPPGHGRGAHAGSAVLVRPVEQDHELQGLGTPAEAEQLDGPYGREFLTSS